MKIYEMELAQMTEMGNTVKETILFALERDGLLNKPATEIASAYAVVLVEPGVLGKLFRKLVGEDQKGGLKVHVMKVV